MVLNLAREYAAQYVCERISISNCTHVQYCINYSGHYVTSEHPIKCMLVSM